MIGIVVSRADSASEHIAEHLLELRDWDEREDDSRPEEDGGGTVYRSGDFEMRTFDELHLSLEGVAAAFDDVDLVAFASRHSGDTGPLLTAHFTGNFGPAKFGGEDGALSTAAPAALDVVVSAFEDVAPDGYDVAIECTHHGPTEVGVPSLFVELGSDEPQWEDPDGARAVARAILALDGRDPEGDRTVVGFGGGHYAPRFERILRETDWTVGHVASDWGLDAMDDPDEARPVVRQAFERSGAAVALFDGEYPELASVVADLGYRVVSETWLREVEDVSPSLVETVETELGTVEDGLRFGDLARDGDPGDVAVVDLPAELLAEARAVDADRTLAAVGETTVAYETEENGNRPVGRAAVREESDRSRLVDRLVSLLEDRYESVERDRGEVVIEERTFDPERARELGIPEGPKFGKLANGQSVTVDGETVRPEAVTVERKRRVTTD